MTDIIDRLLSAAKMAHEPKVLSRINDTDLLDAVKEIQRLRNIVNPGDAAAYEESQAHVERLSSEGALKDAVIEAAKAFKRVVPAYPDEWHKEHLLLGNAIRELEAVSEGLAPDA